jgi:ABC-type spermidine/putrescine transport system permease subunit II
LSILKKIAHYFARKSFCRKAIDEHADLSAFKEKLTRSMVVGLVLIVLSYAIGMPAVLAFSVLAASMGKPLIGIIGGALIYGISTLLFIVGIKMAGMKFFVAINRWLTRIILEKILGDEARTSCLLPSEGPENEKQKG